ncbi:MAG: glycerophosphodiester phosphodiesterase family protein [Candidatus Pacebacteria bacterium]|nr:glycerophosphodiester phosphodiesterase family protein [Candidatus Paceibacterota bacterium]
MGHRGMGQNEGKGLGDGVRPPENTLRSFREALNEVNVIEFDCRLTKDGKVIVMHDETLDRTTNGKGLVSEATYEYIRTLQVGYLCQDESVPTLEATLDCIGRKAVCNLHISGKGIALPVAQIIGEYVANGRMRVDDFLVSCFDFEELRRFKKTMPDVRVGFLINAIKDEPAWLDKCRRLGAYAVHINKGDIDASVVEIAHDNGLKVFVWTVSWYREMKKMLELGVDYICSDRPEIFPNF